MHDASMSEMTRILDRWPGHARLLDVGSYDVNGTYRPMVERRGWLTGPEFTDILGLCQFLPGPVPLPV